MTPDSFRAAGEALWGDRWIAAMARALHCSTRSVRRWSAGSWPVPMGVEHDVELLLTARLADLKAQLAIEERTLAMIPRPIKPPRWMIDEERAKLAKNAESSVAKR